MTATALTARLRRQVPGFALDVELTATRGTLGILGPSGAGKTMLLDMLAGLARPDAGRIDLGSACLYDGARDICLPPERRLMGYVFQDAKLFPHLTVAGNLDYGRKRTTHPPLAERADIVDLLGLGGLLARRPHKLSGGEKQRVAIGRALLSAPQILLMDEPLASLDMARRHEIIPFLERLHDHFAIPLLLVSHNLDEILRLADRVLVMHGGRAVGAGAVEDVINRLDVQSLIGGPDSGIERADPGTVLMAQIEAHDTEDGLTELGVPGGKLTVPHLAQAPGTRLRLRVRARDVALAIEPPKGLSIQNCIPGSITGIEEAGPAQADVLIALSGGAPSATLRARVTRRAARHLQLAPGKPVWALIKSVALARGLDDDA